MISNRVRQCSSIHIVLKAALLSLILTPLMSVVHGEEAPESIQNILPDIKKLSFDPKIIAAVEQQNAKKMTLENIQSQDEIWKDSSVMTDFMKTVGENDLAKYLSGIEARKNFYDEIFVMDNLGANVAMTNKTSDYWQGDEAKFTETYSKGKDAIHISKVKFDESTQLYNVQVSVPVVSSGGENIGAITIGINLDEYEK